MANEVPRATDDPTRKLVAVDPRILPGRMLDEALLRQITAATEAAAATAHNSRLNPKQTLLKLPLRVPSLLIPTYEERSQPNEIKTSASSTDERIADVLTEYVTSARV
jgi:hypothetical protein